MLQHQIHKYTFIVISSHISHPHFVIVIRLLEHHNKESFLLVEEEADEAVVVDGEVRLYVIQAFIHQIDR